MLDGRGDYWTPERLFRSFCLGASVVFLLVVVYTVAVKLPSGALERDWMHSVLHLGSGMLAIEVSVRAAGMRPARAFTIGVVALYGPLSIIGWFIDGLAMGTVFRMPLQPADNLFHLPLALAALSTAVIAHRLGQRAPAVKPR